MSKLLPTIEELKRKALFVPCKDQDALHRWVLTYLGIDFPTGLVDPDSTTSPMGAMWEMYSAMLKGDRPEFTRVLIYSGRDCFKTLGASILEILAVFHCRRSVGHMAAIKEQSKICQKYVKAFLNRPFLRDFISKKNETEIEFLWYDSPDGTIISHGEFDLLLQEEKDKYVEVALFIKIVIATLQGANGLHSSFFVEDEIDIISDKLAYEEAKAIPSAKDGKPAITLLTSTRKFSFGYVQKEIDEATIDPNTGFPSLHVRHWNIIDVTERCPESRHRPDEPRIPIYVNDETLRSINKENFELLDSQTKSGYVKEEGYTGCLKNCSIFAACRGRLPSQTGKSKLLKPLTDIISKFKTMSPQMANAQYLCRKPSTEGLVFPNFNKAIHMLTAYQMARKIVGNNEPLQESIDKVGLIKLMKERQLTFHSGMDFGYTHNFAVGTGALDGQNFYCIDVISMPELEDEQKVDVCDARIKHLSPTLYPDPESPSSIATFKRRGYRVKEVNKYAGSVVAGIEIIRRKLMPSIGLPTLYFLKGDEGCELLAKRFGGYHWKLDAAGRPTDIPDEEDDDELDQLRYAMLSLFDAKGRLTVVKDKFLEKPVPTETQYTQQDWMKKQISLLTGNLSNEGDPITTPGESTSLVKSGSLVFDFT